MSFSRLATPLAMLSVFSMFVTVGCSSSSTNTAAVGGSTALGTTGGSTSTTGGATGTPGGATSTKTSPSVGGASTTTGGTSGVPTSSVGGVTSVGGAPATGGVTTVMSSSVGGAANTGGVAPTTGGTKAATSGGAGTSVVTGGTATAGGAASTGGAGGATSSSGSTLNDLIAAICHWEFGCCNAGETKWELGPLVTTEAQCVTKFQYLLNSDNTAITASPYPGSYAVSGLLLDLAYKLNPANVTENPQGIQQCVDHWKTLACETAPVASTTAAHCSATSYGVLDPCALTNLVTPKLIAGSICNFSLTEGTSGGNDVECVAGTTCLAVGDAANPSTSNPTCVTRGVAAGSCTLDTDCDFNFYCNTAGSCTAKGGTGDPCAYKDAAPVPGKLSIPCKPGLSCNPVSKTCIPDCTANYVCNGTAAEAGNDFICPAGSSCIPITVGNDSTSFKVCSTIGALAGAKCNSLEDCAGGMYCAGTSCAPRQGLGLACDVAVPGNCVTGMYCAGTACASYVGNGKACTQATDSIKSTECNPGEALGCVYLWDTTLTTPAATYICSSTLLANAQRCGNDFDCASNRCEFATLAATFRTCIAGAAAGASCDATLTDGTYTRCGVGLTCLAGQCVAQVGPGGNCESTTTPGTIDNSLCQNGSCNATQWKNVGTGSPIMCTDAPVPVANGGLGATCDGATK